MKFKKLVFYHHLVFSLCIMATLVNAMDHSDIPAPLIRTTATGESRRVLYSVGMNAERGRIYTTHNETSKTQSRFSRFDVERDNKKRKELAQTIPLEFGYQEAFNKGNASNLFSYKVPINRTDDQPDLFTAFINDVYRQFLNAGIPIELSWREVDPKDLYITIPRRNLNASLAMFVGDFTFNQREFLKFEDAQDLMLPGSCTFKSDDALDASGTKHHCTLAMLPNLNGDRMALTFDVSSGPNRLEIPNFNTIEQNICSAYDAFRQNDLNLDSFDGIKLFQNILNLSHTLNVSDRVSTAYTNSLKAVLMCKAKSDIWLFLDGLAGKKSTLKREIDSIEKEFAKQVGTQDLISELAEEKLLNTREEKEKMRQLGRLLSATGVGAAFLYTNWQFYAHGKEMPGIEQCKVAFSWGACGVFLFGIYRWFNSFLQKSSLESAQIKKEMEAKIETIEKSKQDLCAQKQDKKEKRRNIKLVCKKGCENSYKTGLSNVLHLWAGPFFVEKTPPLVVRAYEKHMSDHEIGTNAFSAWFDEMSKK